MCGKKEKLIKIYTIKTSNIVFLLILLGMSSTQVERYETSVHPRSGKITEELLVEKLDKFLNSIEIRLNNFDAYFQNEKDKVDYSVSITEFSINHLRSTYERLGLIKKTVLKSSYINLDNLYKSLVNNYQFLYDEDEEDAIEENFSAKDSLQDKIIKTITYFDEKLSNIDEFLKPHSKLQLKNINILRYYNFNHALKNAKENYIDYYQLPLSWRDNKFIIFGYRFSLSHMTMAKSLFQIHNETMNIYTHFVGFLVVCWLALYHFPRTDVFAKNTFQDNLVIYGFFAAAVKCLIGSCVWHTYSCFAHYPTRARCACVDYTGITVLITASVISAEYATLYNHPTLLKIWIGFSIVCGITSFLFNWSPYFDKPECRTLRIAFFVGLALMGITSMVCMTYFEGLIATVKYFFPLCLKSLLGYLLGTVFYGGLIPERFRTDVIIKDADDKTYSLNDVLLGKVGNDGEEEIEEILSKTKNDDDITNNEEVNDLIKTHFKSPVKTPFANNFFSLWWVDYFMNSHNIWHICVLMGIVGHYYGIIEMFDKISR